MLHSCNRCLLLLFLTLACLLLPVPVARAAPQRQGTTATLQISNRSSHTVCSIYVAASTESEWGDDRLGDDQLAPNATLDIALPPEPTMCCCWTATMRSSMLRMA